MEPPRDVICRLLDFRIKVAIVQKARSQGSCKLEGHDVLIFQGLATVTLKKRKIKLLTDLIQPRKILGVEEMCHLYLYKSSQNPEKNRCSTSCNSGLELSTRPLIYVDNIISYTVLPNILGKDQTKKRSGRLTPKHKDIYSMFLITF